MTPLSSRAKRENAFEAYTKRSQDAVRMVLQGRMQRLFESRERSASNSVTGVRLSLQPQNRSRRREGAGETRAVSDRAHSHMPFGKRHAELGDLFSSSSIEGIVKSRRKQLHLSGSTPSLHPKPSSGDDSSHRPTSSPRISPWNHDNASVMGRCRVGAPIENCDKAQDEIDCGLSAAKFQQKCYAVDLQPASKHACDRGGNAVAENRHLTSATDKMLGLFAKGSSLALLNDGRVLDEEKFSEYLHRKGSASPLPVRRNYTAFPVRSKHEMEMNRYRRIMTGTPIVAMSSQREAEAAMMNQERRARKLLTKLKQSLKDKKRKKRLLLTEEKLFRKEMDLREKLSRPPSPPENSFLPLSMHPRLHPSHPAFPNFLDPVPSQKMASLGHQLSHGRLSGYSFNSPKEGLPQLREEDEGLYRREILESRRSTERNHLSELFRSRNQAVDKAIEFLSETQARLLKQKAAGLNAQSSTRQTESESESDRQTVSSEARNAISGQSYVMREACTLHFPTRKPNLFFPTRRDLRKNGSRARIYDSMCSPAIN